MSEFDIIARYFAPLSAGFPGALGLKDDAALYTPQPGYELVFTQDSMVAGVHFFASDAPDTIARKLLRTNLSDLAAKGAEPLVYLLSCLLPGDTKEAWIAGFTQGLKEDIAQFGGHLAGGDTVSHSGALALTLTAIGQVKQGTMLKRSGALPGDEVYVSGTIGDSYLGLQVISGKLAVEEAEKTFLTGCYHLPVPRLALGQALIGVAHAGMDISDGLVADASHMAGTSGVAMVLFLQEMPFSEAARKVLKKGGVSAQALLSGGDDYEILFTAPLQKRAEIEAIGKKLGVPLARIGQVEKGQGEVSVLSVSGQRLSFQQKGYTHFPG